MCCPSPDCPLVGIHGYCYRTWDNRRCINLHKPSQCTRFHLVSFVVIWVDNVSDTCFKLDSFIRGWGRRTGSDKEPGRVVALLPMVVFEIGLRVNCCLFQTRNHVLLILGIDSKILSENVLNLWGHNDWKAFLFRHNWQPSITYRKVLHGHVEIKVLFCGSCGYIFVSRVIQTSFTLFYT